MESCPARVRHLFLLSIDALIRAKEFMGRPKDKETVLRLRAIQEMLKKE